MSFDPVHNNYLSYDDWLYLQELEQSNRIKDAVILACFATFAIIVLAGGCQYMGWL